MHSSQSLSGDSYESGGSTYAFLCRVLKASQVTNTTPEGEPKPSYADSSRPRMESRL